MFTDMYFHFTNIIFAFIIFLIAELYLIVSL